jgi:hypothetical protein
VCFGIDSWNYLTGQGDPGHWRFHPDMHLRIAGTEHSCGALLLPHFSGQARATWTKNAAVLDASIAAARIHQHATA